MVKLPIKTEVSVENATLAPVIMEYDEFDGWGGAIKGGIVYVKECREGKVIKKSAAIPYRRGMIKGKQVFYYLVRGDKPPHDEDLIPSIWG